MSNLSFTSNRPPSEYWRFVDTFTLLQAAALWCRVEPPSGILDPFNVPDFNAVKHMLIDAIRKGELKANMTKSAIDYGDCRNTTIERAELERWARFKK